jgi:heme exporter protein A
MRLFASDLDCRRGDREVFKGLNFALHNSEILLVTGRNGAGKSSLLRIVGGLLRQSGGLCGLEGGDSERSVAEQAHYVGHLDALKPSLSVLENLLFWTSFLGEAQTPASALEDALDATGLGGLSHLPAAYLSAGQKRRLSLARLLTVKRPLWLLDEPTTALDTAAQARLADLMRAHLAGGGLIMAATHSPLGLDGARELRLGAPA